jgi:ketosteroid isomerase-like protein
MKNMTSAGRTVRARPAVALGLAASLAFLGSCSSPRTATGGSPEAEARALTQLDDAWSAAAGSKDVERIASFYADDAIAYPPNEPAAVGRAAAKRVWAAYFAEPTFRISWKTTHAEVAASGELGYTTGTYEDSFRGADGKTVTERGKYACVWKKQPDGSWKAIHDMWNADQK